MTGDYPSLAAGFGKQHVTATNAYEAIQMAKTLYGKLLISEGAGLGASEEVLMCILTKSACKNQDVWQRMFLRNK
jgi:hypothetical protein